MKQHKQSHRHSALFPLGEVVPIPEKFQDDIEIAPDQLARIDLSSIPEKRLLWVKGSETPLTWIGRRKKQILTFMSIHGEHDERVLTYYALAIAAKILQNEGHPILNVTCEDTGRDVAVRWEMQFPIVTAPHEMMKAVRTSEKAIRNKAKEIMPATE